MDRECSREVLLELKEYGGSGSTLTDAAVVFEQMGAGPLSSGPFFFSTSA
jgi:hypothetical protein